MKKIAFLFFSFWYCLGFGQISAGLPKIMPPSPNSYEITKYGNFQVGNFTGTPNYRIPLYTLKVKNILLPLSLNYSSNGIKVDQVSSNVGLGWMLDSGGVVSRIVRGRQDEDYRLLHPVQEIEPSDLFDLRNTDYKIVEFLFNGYQYGNDTQSDLFSYNFAGHSGSFVFGNNGEVITIPKSDVKINFINNNIKITTNDGIEYFFYDKEITRSRTISCGPPSPELPYTTAWYLTMIKHPLGDIINFYYDNNNTMYSYNTSISQNLSINALYPSPPNHSNLFSFPNPEISTCTNNVSIYSKRLVKIESNNDSILFSYVSHPLNNYKLVNNISIYHKQNLLEKINFTYDYTNNNRVFLDRILFKDTSKKYEFEYIDKNNVPNRLSFSKDFWGYFNGKSNQLLLPKFRDYPIFELFTNNLADRNPDHSFSKKGLLNKITYPTGGYTELKYEANNFYGLKKTYNTIYQNVTIIGESQNEQIFTINNDSEFVEARINFHVSGYYNTQEGCIQYPDHKISAKVTVFDLTDNNTIYQNIFREAGSTYNFSTPVNLSNNHQYKITISNETQHANWCVEANATLRYEQMNEIMANIETGGSRIKSITNFKKNDIKTNYKRFYYGEKNNLNESSGDVNRYDIGYVSTMPKLHNLDVGLGNIQGIHELYYNLSSESIFPIFNSGSNNIYYRTVTISHGDDNFINGGEEHNYIIERDSPGEILLRSSINNDIPIEIPFLTNSGWNNGLESKTEFFKKASTNNFIILKKYEYEYKLDSIFSEISNYYIKKNKEITGVLVPENEPSYQCKLEDINKRWGVYRCYGNHSTHKIGCCFQVGDNNGGPLTSWDMRCRSFGNYNRFEMWNNHICYGKSEGDVVAIPETIENLDVTKYKTRSYWHYLEKKTQIQYDSNGQNPIEEITNYYYNNPEHLQLTKKETRTSKGEFLKTEIFYPQDKNLLANLNLEYSLAIDSLVRQHRIAVPIQTTIRSGNNIISKTRTNFKDWDINALGTNNIIQPKNVLTSSGNNPLENRITYHNYDDTGNPLEVSKANGMHICYIWGYNKTQPIAKIENSRYADLPQTELNALLNFDYATGSESSLSVLLNNLRNALPSTAMATTMTYKPLIGVSTITDPKGDTQYYEYDDFNRLKYVKDSAGSILKETEYHYRP